MISTFQQQKDRLMESARGIADRVKNNRSERKLFLDLQDTYEYNRERKRIRIQSSLKVERAVNIMLEKSVTETVSTHTTNAGDEYENDDEGGEDGEDDEGPQEESHIRELLESNNERIYEEVYDDNTNDNIDDNVSEDNYLEAVHLSQNTSQVATGEVLKKLLTEVDRQLLKTAWISLEASKEKFKTIRQDKWDEILKPLLKKYQIALVPKSVFDQTLMFGAVTQKNLYLPITPITIRL
ncbi:9784_t:CDS:2 [Funneliformis mosseae]|uniref:9784_t:CDS:1 n=1 Tax=Funneliformis mosseae TaxID=27381 RepID=A0A9N8ZYC9_FUNMO|nr:9784_t:CDS:2 [Funneliformis mosseae]